MPQCLWWRHRFCNLWILQKHKNQNISIMKTFFLQIKKFISCTSRTDLWEKYFCSRSNLPWIMAILPKACRPDNFELYNSLNLTFANIQGLSSNFVIVNLSLNQTLLTFLLCVRLTWMTPLIMAISLWEVIFL